MVPSVYLNITSMLFVILLLHLHLPKWWGWRSHTNAVVILLILSSILLKVSLLLLQMGYKISYLVSSSFFRFLSFQKNFLFATPLLLNSKKKFNVFKLHIHGVSITLVNIQSPHMQTAVTFFLLADGIKFLSFPKILNWITNQYSLNSKQKNLIC